MNDEHIYKCRYCGETDWVLYVHPEFPNILHVNCANVECGGYVGRINSYDTIP